METKFKVVMTKDAEVMKDFLSFTYRAQGGRNRSKLYIYAIGMLLIGYMAARDGNITVGNIIAGVGIAMVLMGFIFPKIALMKLKKADEAYKKKTELSYVFTGGKMYVYEDGELVQNVGGYQQVTCFYGDERNYYVGINNDDLYLLPMKCFVEGDPEEFLKFMQKASGEQYEFLPLTLKNKWLKFRTEQKIKEVEYDEKVAEKRKEAKEKKEKRRNK